MSDLKAPTYEDRYASRRSGLYGPTSPVGRAFTVRRPSFREATFSSGGGAPKMSDLKAPIYEDRYASRRSGLYGPTSPVGRAFTVRRPSFREATFSRGGGAPKMSDLKAPTYKNRYASRRSGLYGPTAILSRSDIFKRRWRTEDVGPEGTDLPIPLLTCVKPAATPPTARRARECGCAAQTPPRWRRAWPRRSLHRGAPPGLRA
jgi:hypothetical protein